MENRKIKSRCVFKHNDKILLCHNKAEDYYFFPGGSSNAGESPEDTLHREILEEFGTRIVSVQILTTLINVGFDLNETITMFRAEFIDPYIYGKAELQIIDLPEVTAEWVPIDDIRNKKVRVFPEYDYIKLLETDNWHEN